LSVRITPGAIPKEIVFALSARRLAGRAQLAILITRNGLQSGATDILANYPRLTHFRVDEFRDAIQSGRLDDFLPRLASAQVGDSHELVEFNKVIEHHEAAPLPYTRRRILRVGCD
jgi:hypothetical protein